MRLVERRARDGALASGPDEAADAVETVDAPDQAANDAGPSAAEAFARDVLAGLSSAPRSIPCVWLYDRRGSELFDEITTLD